MSTTLSPFALQIANRHSASPKHLSAPAPDEATLCAAAAAAYAAPSHAKPFPVRFVAIRDREKLAELFTMNLPAEATEEDRCQAAGKARKGPLQIAVILRHSSTESPREAMESAMTAGAALMNFLHVLTDAGFAAKTVSGRNFRNPKGLYDSAEETLAAFIICGTPTDPATSATLREMPGDFLQTF